MTTLSKMGSSMECFTADFLRFLPKNVTIWLLVGRLGTRHQIEAFQRFSGKKVVRQLVRQLVHLLSGDNGLVPFHLW